MSAAAAGAGGASDAHVRMSQIAAQLAALGAGQRPGAASAAARLTGATTGATHGSSAAGASGAAPAGPGSFDALLASALGENASTGTAGGAGSSALASSGLGGAALGASGPDVSAVAAALVAARPAALTMSATFAQPGAAAAAPGPAPASAPTAAPAAAPAPRAVAPAPPSPAAVRTVSAAELASFGNGRVPDSALRPLGVGDHKLWGPAADGFRRMAAAAARDGVSFGVNDSYRSYAEQVDMARRKGLYSQGGLAARPGTSDHGWGKSVDLQLSGRALSWMRAHAADYGFVANVPRESWHWTYKG